MRTARTALALLVSLALFVSLVPARASTSCRMCGASCRCASSMPDGCCAKSRPCGGGGHSDAMTGGDSARAVLPMPSEAGDREASVGRVIEAVRFPLAPDAPPPVPPPRVSC